MRARALAVHALARSRAGSPATAWLLSEYSEAAPQVDKCRVADKKKTDKPTDRQINTHYSFIGIDAFRNACRFPSDEPLLGTVLILHTLRLSSKLYALCASRRHFSEVLLQGKETRMPLFLILPYRKVNLPVTQSIHVIDLVSVLII